MIRPLLHTSWILLLALALLAGGAIYYVGWTPGGLQRLVSLSNRRLGHVTLQISGAHGTLHDGVHIDRVEVDHQRVQVIATNIDGRVALLPLLWQTIRVAHLQVGSVQVHVLPHPQPSTTPWQPHFLVGLLDIQAEDLRVGHAQVISPSGVSLEADRLHAVAQVATKEIRVFDSSMMYAGFEVRSIGTVHAAAPIRLQGQARLSMAATGQPPWLANAQFDGDLDRLPIGLALLAPFNADFRGEARTLSGDWHWLGDAQVRDFDLRAWGLGNALGVVHGALHLSGDRNGFGAQGMLEPPGLKSGPLAVDFFGRYAAHVLEIARFAVVHHASGTQLNASGSVGIETGGPRLELHGDWRQLRWPLASADAGVHSAAGTFTLSGLKPYALETDGALQLLSLPAMHFSASGHIEHSGLDIPDVALEAFGGHAQLRAGVQWAPQESWSLSGAMRGLDIETLRPAINGRLDFNVTAVGQGFGAGSALQAKFTNLGGNVRGQRASGHAGIALAGDDWLLQQVQLQLGATHLEADGRIGAHPDLRFSVDASDLALLHDGARGQLRAAGHFRGDARNPLLLARVSGSALEYQGARLRALNADVDFEPQGSGHANISVQLDQFSVGEHQIAHLGFTTAGTTAAHRYELDLRAPPYRVQASGEAQYTDGVWRAGIDAFTAGDGSALRLALAAPASLVLAPSGDPLRLDNFCLQDAQARLCAALSRQDGHEQLSLHAANVPLRTLTAGLGSETEFDGRISLDAQAEGSGDTPWIGSANGTLSDAAVRHHLSSGKVESFSLGTGSVQAKLDAGGLAASVGLDAGAGGNIAGHLQAGNNGGALRDWPLSGELRLETHSLGFIDSYVAQVDRVSGQLDANLALGGTLAALVFNGDLKLTNAEVDAYQINLALRDLNFEARLKDTQLQLNGSTRAGADGHAQFDGELAWRRLLPYGQLHLSGENLRVVNVPEARVQASPDVRMTFNGRRIDITGTVALPYARLQRPDQLTNAVRASSDEVIVSVNQAPPGKTFHVFSDLTLVLGERVTIDTLGLVGRLSGSLRTVADDSGFNRGTGELQVEEGKYTAYGRKLDIERGKLQFKNGPLNDPVIDLRAIKKFPDITAGVNVRGTLRAPRMTFFSDPPVSQSQIVSLLLAGGSLESVQSNADPAQRSNEARNNMLLQGSALLFQQFGGKVGLDDVSVESGLNNDTSLVLGRYLSPRLYVSYGISLAEAINTIKMRYTIGDHWTIRTEAGTARSADLFYTIER
ncbi:MAG: translocation/assembly module TamB domain-containing protein [Proteobacteria bacterium]|nr:translocation/assembly module TamB domain-containing protein [Pseudomonadota bacterium]